MESVAASTQCADASVTLSDFHFDLPPELIAQVPAERRDQARLLVLDRRSPELAHTQVHDLAAHLHPGDLLVVNDTRVIPARLFGRTASGGAVEVLLVRPLFPPLSDWRRGMTCRAPMPRSGARNEPVAWLCLGKPAKRLRPGRRIVFPENVSALVETVQGNGHYTLAFDDAATVEALLDRHGELPLPPYIHRPDGPLPLDQTRYQTIFASVRGAIAAPTAGLHFTDELLTTVRQRGIEIARLTLHVGPGTFLPLRSDNLREHVMAAEWCEIPEATATRIRQVKAAGGRIVAVGTTTTRALESAASPRDVVASGVRWADRFIVPGHEFRVVDALFTNFHLPGSTLLLLVSAFAGRERILATYGEAIHRRYRFYSYGDAMLIE
jgi:S-adenosylmethionine:tRNA ribosyltransferase-isomerase